jgi:hypothetical protein
MSPETGLRRFVRGLLAGEPGRRNGTAYMLGDGRRADATAILELIHAGVLDGDGTTCRAGRGTLNWLRRVSLESDTFAEQHRVTERRPDGTVVNLAESPLSRLASGADAFLGPHHVEAGERVRRLVERAQLQPRLTMSYSASHSPGKQPRSAAEITDLAEDARRQVANIHRLLPRDCAGVVMDVCGLLKGLQEVERERGWPRRSAKLVLRIGLDRLAEHYGLGPFAIGRNTGREHAWLGEGARPERFG